MGKPTPWFMYISSKNKIAIERVQVPYDRSAESMTREEAERRINAHDGLVEALKEIRGELKSHGDNAKHRPDGCWGCILFEIAKEALAAAEGKES